MLRLHDNASSGNAYKVRLLLTQLGSQVRTHRVRHRPRRDADARVPARQEPERPRPGAGARRRPLPARIERDPLVSGGGHAVPAAARTTRPGAGSARRCCSGCSSSSTATSRNIATVRHWITHNVEMTPEREAALPGKRKWGVAALEVMEQHLRTRALLRRRARTRSPTSRSTRTRTSPPKAASTSRRSPRVRAWLARVAAQPGHIAITD